MTLTGLRAIKKTVLAVNKLLISSNLSEMAIAGLLDGRQGMVHIYSLSAGDGMLSTVMEQGLGLDDYVIQASEWERMRDAKTILTGLVVAVMSMHQLGIAHLDIKPSNVVLQMGGLDGREVTGVALIDFGASRLVHSWCPKGSPRRVMCTFDFAAPESFASGGAHPTFACDAYSIGAVMHFVLYGKPFAVFGKMSKAAVGEWWQRWVDDLVACRVSPPCSVCPAGCDEDVFSAVQGLMLIDRSQRTPVEALYRWFKPGGNLLQPTPLHIIDPPFSGDVAARRAVLAFLSSVCASPASFPLAANIYARLRNGVWPQPSAREARVIRGCAALAHAMLFPDSHVSDAYKGEVEMLLNAGGISGWLSDTIERVLVVVYGIIIPDYDLMWRAVFSVQGTRQQVNLYMALAKAEGRSVR